MARSAPDIALGIFLASLALLGFVGVRNMDLGTVTNMGPAYLPVLICTVLCALAGIKLIQGIVVATAPVGKIAWRPILVTLIAIAAFGYAVEPLGLFLATMLLVVLSTLGTTDRSWLSTFAFAGLLAAGCVVVFVYILRIPFATWPT